MHCILSQKSKWSWLWTVLQIHTSSQYERASLETGKVTTAPCVEKRSPWSMFSMPVEWLEMQGAATSGIMLYWRRLPSEFYQPAKRCQVHFRPWWPQFRQHIVATDLQPDIAWWELKKSKALVRQADILLQTLFLEAAERNKPICKGDLMLVGSREIANSNNSCGVLKEEISHPNMSIHIYCSRWQLR